MKNIFIILALIGLLSACDDQPRQPRKKARIIKVLETGEKAPIINAEHYSLGDTIIVYFTHVGDTNHWKLDENWIKFEGLSQQEMGLPRYYKAILQ